MLGPSRVVAAMCAAALLAAPVLAQPAPTPKEKTQIQDLVKQAIAKSQAGDHAGSIELYQKAFAISPLPTLLSNIGAEYQLDKKPVEALKYFCMYLDKDPAGPLATYATSQAKVLQGQLTNTTIDDATVCKAPKAVAPPDPGNAATPKDMTPAPAEPVDPGKTLKRDGFIIGGAGVLTVGLGIYFGVQAKDISDDISNHKDTTVQWRSDIVSYQDRGQRDEYLQIALLIVGGAAIVTGGVLYFKGRGKSSEVSVAPTASPNGGGMVLSGSF